MRDGILFFMGKEMSDLPLNPIDCENTDVSQHPWASLSEYIIYNDGEEADAWAVIVNKDLGDTHFDKILEKPPHGLGSLCKVVIDLIYISIEYESLALHHFLDLNCA